MHVVGAPHPWTPHHRSRTVEVFTKKKSLCILNCTVEIPAVRGSTATLWFSDHDVTSFCSLHYPSTLGRKYIPPLWGLGSSAWNSPSSVPLCVDFSLVRSQHRLSPENLPHPTSLPSSLGYMSLRLRDYRTWPPCLVVGACSLLLSPTEQQA